MSYQNEIGTINERRKFVLRMHGNSSQSPHRRYNKFKGHPYFKELEKSYVNAQTPGPAAYNTLSSSSSNFRRSVDLSFSKVSF